ncbi:hypothetical protein LP419_06310 [Massilia sp. H-1]|nr:hypothetical protein LP419_06310 [Massilia sp. H-1]
MPASGLNILSTLQRERDAHGRESVTDDALQTDADAPIARPVYLPGPASWEQRIGHHDDRTDVFSLGMILAALSCGLDFADQDDLRSFVAHRTNLFLLQQRLHPVLAAVIVEMTELNRHSRATEVAALALRLRTWRDQPSRARCRARHGWRHRQRFAPQRGPDASARPSVRPVAPQPPAVFQTECVDRQPDGRQRAAGAADRRRARKTFAPGAAPSPTKS